MKQVTEIQIEIPSSSLDAVESLLYLQGIDGLVIEDETTGPGEGRDPLPRGRVRLLAYVDEPPPATLQDMVRQWAQDASLSLRQIDPDLYRDRWKEHFKPAQVSFRLWVLPSWEKLPRPLTPEEHAVIIDPGSAFGTGLHETTRLCLHALDRLIQPGDSLLDVGTGSGILAIAGRYLGASFVLATDNDPLAILAARENVERNGFSDILIEDTPLERIDRTFSVVVANILAVTLLTLKDELLARVAPGGALILSGLLATELSFVRDYFQSEEVSLEGEEIMGEWGSLCFRRREVG